MIEIELKCELLPSLLERVSKKTQNMTFKGTIHNNDIYYDTPTWDFLKKAVFIRVRNSKRVEFKFNEDLHPVHGQNTERVFSLVPSVDTDTIEKMNALFASFLPSWISAASFEDAVKQNGLIELATIHNTREEYTGEDIILSIDHVEGLGNFLEVETQAEEETDTRKAQERLQAFVSDLEVKHINVGYVELWLSKHNPEAYNVGKYHLA